MLDIPKRRVAVSSWTSKRQARILCSREEEMSGTKALDCGDGDWEVPRQRQDVLAIRVPPSMGFAVRCESLEYEGQTRSV